MQLTAGVSTPGTKPSVETISNSSSAMLAISSAFVTTSDIRRQSPKRALRSALTTSGPMWIPTPTTRKREVQALPKSATFWLGGIQMRNQVKPVEDFPYLTVGELGPQ